MSDVPHGTVLGPLLFSLYINDISTDIDSDIRLFADDCVCYREIKDTEDTLKLKEDVDILGCWARKWGMRFQPAKCNMMQITRKQIKKESCFIYSGGNGPRKRRKHKVSWGHNHNYLKWNTHVRNICTKANRTRGILRRNLYAFPQEMKEAAYKGLMRSVLKYSGSVWDPSGVGLTWIPGNQYHGLKGIIMPVYPIFLINLLLLVLVGNEMTSHM